MYKLAFVALLRFSRWRRPLRQVRPRPATRVTVSPVYVPAVYCSYKSKDWMQKGIVTCPLDWAPLGDLGTKWKTASGGCSKCWSTNGFGGKEYDGLVEPLQVSNERRD